MPLDSRKAEHVVLQTELKGGLGGSEALAYCGKDPRCTMLELYEQKIAAPPKGDAPLDDDPRREWGHRLEPVVRQWLEEKINLRIVKPLSMYRSKSVPMMIGHVDGITQEPKPAGVEIKTADKFMAAEFGDIDTDQVPVRYILQVTHYMVVTGLRRFHIAVLIGGNEPKKYVVDFDPELAGMLIANARLFWSHVETHTPPDPKTLADTARRWPRSLEKSVIATPSIIESLCTLKAKRAAQKCAEEEGDALEVLIKASMADASALTDGNHQLLATWRSQSRSRFDVGRFTAEHPEFVDQYKATSEFRVFRLK